MPGITRANAIDHILKLPGEIADAEMAVIDQSEVVVAAKNTLAEAESALQISGVLEAAQIHLQTHDQRMAVIAAENDLARLQQDLQYVDNDFLAYRTVARILSRH